MQIRQYESRPRDMPPALIRMASELNGYRDRFWKELDALLAVPAPEDGGPEG